MNRKYLVALFALVLVFAIIRLKNSRQKPGSQVDLVAPTQEESTPAAGAGDQAIARDPKRQNPAYTPVERRSVSSIPVEKVDQVKNNWKSILEHEGFKTTEFDFKNGYIRSASNNLNGPQVGVWVDRSGACQLELPLQNFLPTAVPGQVVCKR